MPQRRPRPVAAADQPPSYQNRCVFKFAACETLISPETSDLWTQVLQSVQTLVQPLRLHRLTIQPISLLVSIHASLKLYIASDHTPLSFSLFERGPVCTTARQLVHALAMHYAAGALFRAGTCRPKESRTIFHPRKPHVHFKLACVSRICARPVFPVEFSRIQISLFLILCLTSIYITEREI